MTSDPTQPLSHERIPGLWDGTWRLTRQKTRLDSRAPRIPGVAPKSVPGPSYEGMQNLPPQARRAVQTIVDSLDRNIDTQINVPTSESSSATVSIVGDPSSLEIIISGAGALPEPSSGTPLIVLVDEERRAQLDGVASCVIDHRGNTSSVTPALAELTRTNAAALETYGLRTVIDQADHERLGTVAIGQEEMVSGLRLARRSGEPQRWIDVRGLELTSSDGDVDSTSRLLILTELTSRAGALAAFARRAEAAFEQAETGRVRIDSEGLIEAANPALAMLVGIKRTRLIGRRLVELIDPRDRGALEALMGGLMGGRIRSFEHDVRLDASVLSHDLDSTGDPGELISPWLKIQAEMVLDGSEIDAEIQVRDVTLRRQAELSTRLTIDALRSAFLHAPSPIALLSLNGTFIETNQELRDFVIRHNEGDAPKRLADVVHPDDRDDLERWLSELTDSNRVRFECRLLRRDGSDGFAAVTISRVGIPGPDNDFAVAHLADLTQQKRIEERLIHQTLHDPLTGLANRVLLIDRLEQALARLSNLPFAVLFVDLDHFKLANDNFGHEFGDAILIEIGRRLRECVRADDTVARLGGDEFVIVALGIGTMEQAQVLADKVTKAIGRSYKFNGSKAEISAAVGYVLGSESQRNPSDVIHMADSAMYKAKSQGRNQNPAKPTNYEADALMGAIERNELELHYQPVVDLRTARAIGTEALLRERDGRRGAGRLLALSDDPATLVHLAGWVLDSTIDQLMGWDEAGIGPMNVWINLKGPELSTDLLIDRLSESLTQVDPNRIYLEIPEPALNFIDRAGLDRLEALSALGIQLGIDDFGTGSAALAHLRSLPMRFIKIDPTISARLKEPGGRAVVEAVIAMGKALGLSVIAEGIEERSQLETLAQLGCTHAQGNLFAAPSPPELLSLTDSLAN